ncbi:type II toxin-antitoxin system PemK/MazF family toxin [Brasilonema sp. UFV-L1]|nr:type II toxin-antitoxin system PemK/MazF family toxin [Brasilonema sp. UFV-L1]
MTDLLQRGEVWLANLNPTQGSEQAHHRNWLSQKVES